MSINPIKWTDPGSPVVVIAGDGSAITLKNQASGTWLLSNEIDPASSGVCDQWATYVLNARYQSNPTKGIVMSCWFVLDVGDGNNYDITNASNTPTRKSDFDFYGYALTTQQRLQSWPQKVERPAHPYKILVNLQGGAQMTNTNDENQLLESTFNEAVVTP